MKQVTAAKPDEQTEPLTNAEVRQLGVYRRVANYVSVGQSYLLDNPLPKKPPDSEHTKPRLRGHCGTSPGLNFLYARLNRTINTYDWNVILIAGQGHGGWAPVVNSWLGGSYCELCPSVSQDTDGMRRPFKQFPLSGAVGSHAAAETASSRVSWLASVIGRSSSKATSPRSKLGDHAVYLKQFMREKRIEHKESITQHEEALPEIQNLAMERRTS